MEKKRKAYEKKIKEQMFVQVRPSKSCLLYIEFPKNVKTKKNKQPVVLKRKIIPIYQLMKKY